ncbi:unnamed protein product [Tenebrio molitor]|nr:unnamed protein product [Tenebrio molitor]
MIFCKSLPTILLLLQLISFVKNFFSVGKFYFFFVRKWKSENRVRDKVTC